MRACLRMSSPVRIATCCSKFHRCCPAAERLCRRCGRVLAKQPSGSPDLPLALTVAAAIMFVIANTLPLMELLVGRALCQHDDRRRRVRDVDAG